MQKGGSVGGGSGEGDKKRGSVDSGASVVGSLATSRAVGAERADLMK